MRSVRGIGEGVVAQEQGRRWPPACEGLTEPQAPRSLNGWERVSAGDCLQETRQKRGCLTQTPRLRLVHVPGGGGLFSLGRCESEDRGAEGWPQQSFFLWEIKEHSLKMILPNLIAKRRPAPGDRHLLPLTGAEREEASPPASCLLLRRGGGTHLLATHTPHLDTAPFHYSQSSFC